MERNTPHRKLTFLPHKIKADKQLAYSPSDPEHSRDLHTNHNRIPNKNNQIKTTYFQLKIKKLHRVPRSGMTLTKRAKERLQKEQTAKL